MVACRRNTVDQPVSGNKCNVPVDLKQICITYASGTEIMMRTRQLYEMVTWCLESDQFFGFFKWLSYASRAVGSICTAG